MRHLILLVLTSVVIFTTVKCCTPNVDTSFSPSKDKKRSAKLSTGETDLIIKAVKADSRTEKINGVYRLFVGTYEIFVK